MRLILACLMLGCSPVQKLPDQCPLDGNSRCSGMQVQSCSRGPGGNLVWSAAADCPGDQSCQADGCADPSADQLSQAASAEAYVDLLAAQSAWPDIDGAQLKSDAHQAIVKGDGTNLTFFTAMRKILLAVPEGHQELSSGRCNTAEMFTQDFSRFGVCGRPHGDDLVVTYAEAQNPLGLAAGDLITSAGSDSGAALLDAASRRPVCGASSPSDWHRRTSAAASFFGSVPAGMVLGVTPIDGSGPRTVTVPDQAGHSISCQDPLGRDINFNAKATLRSDGIAVIRLARLYPLNQMLSANPTQAEIDQFIADFQATIQTEFDTVKTARAIIWDARSNYGGLTLVGLAIAGGMPGARATDLSYCVGRIPSSQPPAYYPDHYAVYSVTPGGPFAFSGKAAVLTDGLDYSAADYFAYAVAHATDVPILGTPTAGAYGGPGPSSMLDGPPQVTVNYDNNRCLNAADSSPLEGKSTMPIKSVEYDPNDLAKGVDTVLEAAVALVN